jgi:hypothetical protein
MEDMMKNILQLSASMVLAATLIGMSTPSYATQQGNDTNTWIKFCSLSAKCHWRVWPTGGSIDIIWGGTVIICPMPAGPCTPMRTAPPKRLHGIPDNSQQLQPQK